VTVSVEGTAHAVSETRPDGHFTLEDIPAGSYELTASLTGFAPATRSFQLRAGEMVNLSLTLWVGVLQETVVTAAKTGERDVQSTPLSVSVLSQAELERVNAHTVEHITGLAPSVTFSQNTGWAQLTIRGIGTNAVFAGSDPSSAVYVDGVYLARPAMVLADFMELERVEVLRGPQGTLYGRNVVGGALNVITKAPTNEGDASARVVVGDHGAVRSEARLSGPIVPGKIMASGAFLRGFRRGFVRDVDHPESPLGGEDVTGGRGQLRVVFNPRSELLLSADVTHQDPTPLTYAKVLAVKPGFQVDNPSGLHDVRTSSPAESRSLQYGASARLTFSLTPATTLTSLTAFRKLDYDVSADTDITELDLAATRINEIHHQVSEEVTVAQRRRGFAWVGGLFLFDEVDRQPTWVRLGGPRVENRLNPRVDATARAVFGQATVDLTPRASVTAGLRYSYERKTIDNAGELYTLDLPVTLLQGSAYAYTDAMSHTAWTPKFGLDVRVRPKTLAYVSATRGFKSGGFNVSSPEPGRGYHPEWAWSYEGGVKTQLRDGRANLNASVFYTDYTDLQVQTTIRPGVLDISNAAAATIRGVELEGVTRLTPALLAGGHLAWLDSSYDRYVAVGVGGVTGDVAGNRLANAPEWSGRLWLEWNAGIGGTGLLSVRGESRWQTTVYFTPFNDAIQRQRAYGVVDVSAELGPRRRNWSIAAFARNLTNEGFITGSFSSPPPAIGGRPGDPRQFGLMFAIRR
jgi:iron complex outermembrane receptor protein